MIAILIAIVMLFKCYQVQARVFSKCDFLAELRKQNVEKGKLATYMCIADHSSRFNTKHVDRSADSSATIGIFQVSDRYWCSTTGSRNNCQVPCYRLRDDDVTDDIQCARMIERKEGFKAWGWALSQCEKQNLQEIYISGC